MPVISAKSAQSLTSKQEKFVDYFVTSGCTQTEAARQAGYRFPQYEGYRLVRTPSVQSAIQQSRRRLYCGELSNVAVGTLREILVDSGAPASARVSAARTVLELAGDLGKRDEQGSVKPLSELTPDELSGMIRQWEDERSSLLKEVSPAGTA